MPAFRLTLVFCLLFIPGLAVAAPSTSVGLAVPDFSLQSPAATADRDYLQLDATAASFTLNRLPAEVLLLELLNVHCPHCQMQAPIYNALFQKLTADSSNRGRIKMLGIAVGNQPQEVATFRNQYQVGFPLLADPDFTAWRHIGGGATPMTLYIRQDHQRQTGIIAAVHEGLNPDYRLTYQKLLQLAETDPEELRRKAAEGVERRLAVKPILSAELLEFRVRTAITRFGIIADFSELSLLSGRKVYSARMQDGQQLFAEVISRSSVCDVCHDVHFIYLFDGSTQVIEFVPLQLTKYGNAHWSEQEVAATRKNLLGRYLSVPQPFDPRVDAVTSATMTSAIIFNSLSQGEELIAELRAQGLL